MRSPGLIAVALLVFTGVEVRAQVSTDLMIDDVKVVDVGMGQFKITATGKMSLAAGDTLDAYKFTFFDPNKKEVAPTFQPPFYPPKPGRKSTFSLVWTTDVKGEWSFIAEMFYSNGDKKNAHIPKSRKFSVPSKI